MEKAVWFSIFFVSLSIVAIYAIVIAQMFAQVPEICSSMDTMHISINRICLPKYGWSGSTGINAQGYMAVTLFHLQK